MTILYFIEVIIYALCSAVGIMAALCGLLTKVMKKIYYIILFVLTFSFGVVCITTTIGQKVTIPVIITMFLIIFIGSEEHKIINLCIACLGYMFDVILNQIILYAVHIDLSNSHIMNPESNTREEEKMKKRIRKLISIGMILCMCTQTVPAFASEETISENGQNVIAGEYAENIDIIEERTEENMDLEENQSNKSESASDTEIEGTDPDSVLDEEEEIIQEEQPEENTEDNLILEENDPEDNEGNTDSPSEAEESENEVEENTITLKYQAHIQGIGWQEWKENGEYSGTKGQSFRLEAIKIQLTGEVADYYDIYYRTHVQNIGWDGRRMEKRQEARAVLTGWKPSRFPSE